MRPGLSHGSGTTFTLCGLLAISGRLIAAELPPGEIHKVSDLIVYQDEKFYCAFPSVVRRPDGELLVAFRRAPNRRLLGEPNNSHTDPNSYLVMVRSRDNGKTWSKSPSLIYANPFGGSQDPCLLQLRDGTLLCSSYGWAEVRRGAIEKMKGVARTGDFAFLGGCILRSRDGGNSWSDPILPPPTPGESTLGPFGQSVPAYNRGAMCQGRDGNIYWAVASQTTNSAPRTETHLMISPDKGISWKHVCRIAGDDKITFNETSLYETPKGELVAFMRSENFNDHTCIARSHDHGKTFEPWQDTGFQGHPHYALPLPDQRVLLVYGYRHPPFGVRARVLDAECKNVASSSEIVLRADGGNGDLGYPWATLLSKKQALVVYYFNQADGLRYIAGTILDLDAR
jgi:sialidase-1